MEPRALRAVLVIAVMVSIAGAKINVHEIMIDDDY
jgi:hypothetical protein